MIAVARESACGPARPPQLAASRMAITLLWTIAPIATTAFLHWTSDHPVTLLQDVLVFILFAAPALSYSRWQVSRYYQLPIFSIVSMLHALFFGVSVYWGRRLAFSGHEIPPEIIIVVLEMAVLGVTGTFVGMHLRLCARQFREPRLPDVPLSSSRWWLIRGYVFIGAVAVFFVDRVIGHAGGARQPLLVLFIFVPNVAFLLLWAAWLANKAESLDKMLVVSFLLARALGTLASGWMGAYVALLFMVVVGYVRYRWRFPFIPLIAVVLGAAFLQVGKMEFRGRYWRAGVSAGMTEKITFWVGASWRQWQAAASRGDFSSIRELATSTLIGRASLVSQAAVIYERTPGYVPYQMGSTYSYLVVTLVPRFLWPDKPSASAANRFYQVAYGITASADLDKTSIAAGLIPEAYMNFGWSGVFAVMLVVGVVLEAYQHLLLRPRSGNFAWALGGALILPLMIIEEQAAMYFGGVIQAIGFTFLAFLPLLEWPPRVKEKRRPLAGVARSR